MVSDYALEYLTHTHTLILIREDSMNKMSKGMGNVPLFYRVRIFYLQYKHCKWFQVLSVFAQVLYKHKIPP